MGQDLLADMAGGMTDALVDVQVAGQRAEDAAVDKLNALFATAYSYWTGPSEDVPETETDANARQDNLAEAVNEAGQEAERVDPDGFDWARAQAHIDAVMDENAGGYTGIQVAGLEVQTPYQNTSTRKGYRDPFFGGLSEADMLKQHPDVYYAVMGKASPEQVQGTMQVAVELGVVHEHAGKSEDEALTQRDIESWAKAESIGVDCIGLVMNMLVTSEAYGDFDAGQRSDYATMMNVNVTRFIAASTELESPDLWRPLDALTWVGHVVMVRDVKPLDGGIVFLDCVESSGSTGPRHSKYWYTPEGNASGAHFATSEAAAREGGQRGFIQSDACVRRAGQHDVEALSEQAGVT